MMVSHNATEVIEKGDLRRGQAAWHMSLADILLGHQMFGHDYAMSGDHRPGVKS